MDFLHIQTRRLVAACRAGQAEMAQDALNKGADVNTLVAGGTISYHDNPLYHKKRIQVKPLMIVLNTLYHHPEKRSACLDLARSLMVHPKMNMACVARETEYCLDHSYWDTLTPFCRDLSWQMVLSQTTWKETPYPISAAEIPVLRQMERYVRQGRAAAHRRDHVRILER